MDKEDLNRQFGNPEKQKPITPLDLLAAAHLIREHCNNADCITCIFNKDIFRCALFEVCPCTWELSNAEHKTADWIDKTAFQGRACYFDTDRDMKE